MRWRLQTVHQMASVTSVPEPYNNQDWSFRRSVIGHNWFLNDQIRLSDYAVCLLYEQWQQCLKILDLNCRLGCKTKSVDCFLCKMIDPQNGGCVKFVNIAENLIIKLFETDAEILPKDGSSKVAWPLRPCNVCLFFTWRRATMKFEGFLMVVCCLKQKTRNAEMGKTS